ncbi:PET domain [Brachionus plicatilis]|uniref:PET domain n=1 Tax=Brachionus plicatilis TaxID=10195 RepID=A0A3M7R4Y0_BRAPC|nr:PET domain [Brachionus plicatilis]
MENYDWVPPCLNELEVEEFFSHFPQDQVPLEQLGINNRKKYLFHQIPKSDLAIEFNRFIKNDSTKKSFYDFLSNRSLLAFDVALCMKNSHKNLQCNKCHFQILIGTVYVQAMDKKNVLSNYKNFVYHPNCFKCSTCEHFLADLAYCMHNNKLYCVRHYGDLFRPRCGICDEGAINTLNHLVLFSKPYSLILD